VQPPPRWRVGIPWRGCDANLHAVPCARGRRSAASSPRGLRCRLQASNRSRSADGRSRPRLSATVFCSRCLASFTLGLPVTSSSTMVRPSTRAAPAAHRAATSPPLRSTRMLPSNRKLRSASSGGTRASMQWGADVGVRRGPVAHQRITWKLGSLPGTVEHRAERRTCPSARVRRPTALGGRPLCAVVSPTPNQPRLDRRPTTPDRPARLVDAPQLLPFQDARRAEGGCLLRAVWTSPATSGLPAVPGVAALLGVHLGSTRRSTSAGWYPARCHRHHPPAFLSSLRLSSQALVPAVGVAATARHPTPGPFCEQVLVLCLSPGTCRCRPDRWGKTSRMGTDQGRQSMAAIGLVSTATGSLQQSKERNDLFGVEQRLQVVELGGVAALAGARHHRLQQLEDPCSSGRGRVVTSRHRRRVRRATPDRLGRSWPVPANRAALVR
jgi:hypothetical protein